MAAESGRCSRTTAIRALDYGVSIEFLKKRFTKSAWSYTIHPPLDEMSDENPYQHVGNGSPSPWSIRLLGLHEQLAENIALRCAELIKVRRAEVWAQRLIMIQAEIARREAIKCRGCGPAVSSLRPDRD